MLETNVNKNIKVKYIRDDSGKALAMEQNNQLYYFIYNAHGDVTKITNDQGTVTASYNYDEFGNITSSTGTIYNPLRYAAGYNAYFDSETNLYKMGARYYKAEIGRWITRDDAEPAEPEPETFHEYVIVKNNPLNYIDPTGLAYLKFNGRNAWLHHDGGRLWKGPYKTITGYPKIGWSQKYIEGRQHGGPIPPGNWKTNKRQELNNKNSKYSWDSWGHWRLGPLAYTGGGYGTYNRNGFFIHGGRMEDSDYPSSLHWTQGCIKTRNKFLKFLYEKLPDMNYKILRVHVRYGKKGGIGSKSADGNRYNGGYRYKEKGKKSW